MRTVWKYQLERTYDPQPILIPFDSLGVPHIALQGNTICLWCEVETDKKPVEYTFYIRGTGHEIPADVAYLNTVLMDNGLYVWHVFVSQ